MLGVWAMAGGALAQTRTETGAPAARSGAGASELTMREACKNAAAPMHGVQPRVTVLDQTIRALPAGGFALVGTVNKGGPAGVKKFSCVFKASRALERVVTLPPDGE